ncbi:hypothetical protein HDU76_013033 [Blyttiomyces sp. JEL0837]|nr:hypothetical protein HDU76_013033 [Blyttiomyces sp. JEL0837]
MTDANTTEVGDQQLAPANFWQSYVHGLETRPVLYKAGTAATLNFTQELVATVATGGIPDLKAVKMAVYGFAISGPLGHYLYLGLDKAFKDRKGSFWTVMKILSSNLIISPIQNSVYLMAMALIAGQSVSESIKTTKKRLFSVMKTTWAIFPVAQAFAFKNLPPALWLPFFNFIAFSFGLYLNILGKLAMRKKSVKDK